MPSTLLSKILGPPTADAPVPVRRELYVQRFLSVSRFVLRKLFSGLQVNTAGLVTEASKPMVLYTNHPSFWDPLTCAAIVSRTHPHHHIFAPIDELALKRFWFFQGLGFFGLKVDSRAGLRTFLETGKAVLNEVPCPCLIVTAEGRFTEPTSRPIRLKRGLAKLLSQDLERDIHAIPLALDYRLGEDPRPRIFSTFGAPMLIRAGSNLDMSELQGELSWRLEQAMDRNLSQIQGGEHYPNLLEAAK